MYWLIILLLQDLMGIILFLLSKVTENIQGIVINPANIQVDNIINLTNILVESISVNTKALITLAEIRDIMDHMARKIITNTTTVINITITAVVITDFIMAGII